MKHYTIALVGNPNVGKSAWINQLANENFKVGNWPGVTVEKKEAVCIEQENCYHFIDLPGTYSLQENRDEGRITAHFLQKERIDLILNVCDSLSLKRSLRLTLQLRELQLPMVIVCGYADVARRRGIEVDSAYLQKCLGIDVCFLSAHERRHRQILWQMIKERIQKKCSYPPIYGRALASSITMLQDRLSCTVKEERLRNSKIYAFFRKEYVEGLSQEMYRWQDSFTMEFVWTRYDALIDELLAQSYRQRKPMKAYGLLDRLLLHPLLAYPLCLLFFYWFLQMVFKGSTPWSDYLRLLSQDYLVPYIRYWLRYAPSVFSDFLCDGIVQAMAGVLSFVPLMGTLYFWIAFLEESGYYARIAFLCDRLMSYFHLSGKAFLALLLGAGCNVPGVIASRSLETQKQRILTALLVPFISCGARLPIYLLFCASFFKGKEAIVVASLYGLGLFVAFFCAWILTKFTQFQETSIQVFELPPYRIPSIRVLGKSAAEECWNYVKKAFRVVLLVMIVLWSFSYFPTGEKEQSYLAKAAQRVSFLFEPLGFGDRWECVAALPGGIVAKESILAFLYPQEAVHMRAPDLARDVQEIVEKGVESAQASLFLLEKEETTTQAVRLWEGDDAPLKAYSFLVFVLLSIPCVMTLSAIRSLYGRKLMLYAIVMMCIIPYVLSFLIYQGISFLWLLRSIM